VIVTLTTGGMIPSETNSPPGEVNTVIETLTTGRMIPSETNRHCVYLVWRSISLRGYHPPVVSVTITVSTSPGGLLVPEDIIPTVVSVTITVSTSPGELLVPEGIIPLVVSVSTRRGRHSDSSTDYWGMIPSETNRPPDEVDTVIVTLTTGGGW
jgi:hypothetical protein